MYPPGYGLATLTKLTTLSKSKMLFGNLNKTLTKKMEGNPRQKKNVVRQIRYYICQSIFTMWTGEKFFNKVLTIGFVL
jgi:hypothetical protein